MIIFFILTTSLTEKRRWCWSPLELKGLTLWLPEWNLGDSKFSNFWFYGQNLKVWPFIGKLLSSTLLWCCFYPVCNLSIVHLTLSGVRGLNTYLVSNFLICNFQMILICTTFYCKQLKHLHKLTKNGRHAFSIVQHKLKKRRSLTESIY